MAMDRATTEPVKFRQCPICATVLPAGKFEVVTRRGVFLRGLPQSMRRCPDCGYTGYSQDFKSLGYWAARGHDEG